MEAAYNIPTLVICSVNIFNVVLIRVRQSPLQDPCNDKVEGDNWSKTVIIVRWGVVRCLLSSLQWLRLRLLTPLFVPWGQPLPQQQTRPQKPHPLVNQEQSAPKTRPSIGTLLLLLGWEWTILTVGGEGGTALYIHTYIHSIVICLCSIVSM